MALALLRRQKIVWLYGLVLAQDVNFESAFIVQVHLTDAGHKST